MFNFQSEDMADKYILRVTAGANYDVSSHIDVPVNTPQTVKVTSPLADVELNVRVRNYRGLPASSPSTSPYFDQEPHAANGDQYSICLRFTPKRASAIADGEQADRIAGEDLQFGNNFDHPIRDHLPPGFNTALNIVKWWIDPGLEGDAYADAPYLFGPALSSFNTVHCGAGDYDQSRGGLLFEEGGDETGLKTRAEIGAPPGAKERMKWALRAPSKEAWRWEYGRTYGLDFFNPYLDFDRFAVRLPGFKMSILRYWDGQALRYVLRNRRTKETYLVVRFMLYLKEDVGEDGQLKVSENEAMKKAAGSRPQDPPSEDEGVDSEHEIFGREKPNTSADDVD